MPIRRQATVLDAFELISRSPLPEGYDVISTVNAKSIACESCGVGVDEDCTSDLLSRPQRRNAKAIPLLCPSRIERARKAAAIPRH